jgi:peptidoglycan-associated lipoprotein
MMTSRNIIRLSLVFLFIAGFAASGCSKRMLTKGESERLETLAAKISQAEAAGAKECAPRELAEAKVALEHARHEASEAVEIFNEAVAEAEKAVAALMEKMKNCKPGVVLGPDGKPINPDGTSGDKGTGDKGTAGGGGGDKGPGDKPAAPVVNPGDADKPAPFRPAPVPKEQGNEGSFENIYFDFDQSVIREDAKPILLVIASYMKNNPKAKLLVEGHCDERGTSEYNMALGQRRADATRAWLVNLGIAAERMTTVSFGKERPLVQGHDEAAWAKNRRAVFVLTP